MKIRDLYKKYEIMPQLQTHQLRVGGIAKLITKEWEDRKEAHECVVACLLHDMGNIVKFNGLSPMWSKVQEKYIANFGNEAHEATTGILKEAGLENYAEYVEEEKRLYLSTPKRMEDFVSYSKPAILILYADVRVTPVGVASWQVRADDLAKRYGDKRTEYVYAPVTEKYVQNLCSVEVAGIRDSDVEPLFDELLDIQI